jgi:hypothetical protein
MTLSPTSAVTPSPQLLSKQASLHLTVLTPLVFPWILEKKRSLGLSPMGHDSAEIKPDALMDLLKASKAKLVILATCASSTLGLKDLKKARR